MQPGNSVYSPFINRFIPFVILFLSGAAAASSFPDGNASDHMVRGDQFYRTFDNASALEEYQEAYRLDPKDPGVLVRMIRIHNDIGRLMLRKNDSAEVWYIKAVDYAEQLRQVSPDKAESYFWLALTKGSLVPFIGSKGKLDLGKEATALARRAIQIDSTFAPSYIILGIIYREADRLKWYERLIANTIFGGSLPGTIGESEQMFRRCLALDPTSIFASYELSRTYAQMGNEQKRVEILRYCISQTPHNLREKDQQDQARRQLERALANPPHAGQ